jgi:integrase
MASTTKRTTADGVRYDVRYRTPEGKVRTKTFRRSRDAQAFSSTIEADKVRGDWLDPLAGRQTFAELAEQWLAVADVKAKTRAGYRSILDRHLLPRFGAEPIAKLTPAAIEGYLAELRAAEPHRRPGATTTPGTVRNVRNVLSAVCRYAVRAGALRYNPAADIVAPKGQARREMLFLTAAQVNDLADAIDERYRLAVVLSAYTGVRAGELAALKVGRVEMLRRRLHVVESIAEVHGQLVTNAPKNGRSRTVPLPRFLLEPLAAELTGGADAYVFSAPEGGPIRHSNVYRRYFKPAAAAIGLPDLRWHDLRHTAVSFMVAGGIEPLVISRALGHGSISVTYDVYGHILPSQEDALGDAMDRVFAGADPRDGAEVRAMDARWAGS